MALSPLQSPYAIGEWRDSPQPLSVIAKYFGGTLIGADVVIHGVASLSSTTPHTLSFALASAKSESVQNTRAIALIAHPHWESLIKARGLSAILSTNPYPLFAKIAHRFFTQPLPAKDERHLSSVCVPINDNVVVGAFTTIGDEVSIGEGSCIGAHVSIGDRVKIGRRVWIYPHVTLYSDTVIGDDVMIHSGTVIGADGFGFQPEVMDGIRYWQKVPQMAKVIIGNRVEIGANCCIDRGALSDTLIGDDCKFDNMVHIAHGCVFGKRNLFMAQSVVAGSVQVGDDCIFGGQSCVAPGIHITDGVTIHPKASVLKDINEPGEYSGMWPLQPHRAWLRTQTMLKNGRRYVR